MAGETRAILVAGTGTGVGKTHVACAVVRALRDRGISAVGLKPVETGVPAAGGGEGTDQERLWNASNTFHVKQSDTEGFHVKRSLYAFPEPVSPHLAARLVGKRIDLTAIRRWVREQPPPVVVETAGGLFSPLGPEVTNLDLVRALRPNVLILVAPDRLGVLHDLTATLGLAAARACTVDATVMSAPHSPDSSTGTNAAELERLGIARPLVTFPRALEDHPATLAAATDLVAALGWH
jgi:dethiobiotin synthetase